MSMKKIGIILGATLATAAGVAAIVVPTVLTVNKNSNNKPNTVVVSEENKLIDPIKNNLNSILQSNQANNALLDKVLSDPTNIADRSQLEEIIKNIIPTISPELKPEDIMQVSFVPNEQTISKDPFLKYDINIITNDKTLTVPAIESNVRNVKWIQKNILENFPKEFTNANYLSTVAKYTLQQNEISLDELSNFKLSILKIANGTIRPIDINDDLSNVTLKETTTPVNSETKTYELRIDLVDPAANVVVAPITTHIVNVDITNVQNLFTQPENLKKFQDAYTNATYTTTLGLVVDNKNTPETKVQKDKLIDLICAFPNSGLKKETIADITMADKSNWFNGGDVNLLKKKYDITLELINGQTIQFKDVESNISNWSYDNYVSKLVKGLNNYFTNTLDKQAELKKIMEEGNLSNNVEFKKVLASVVPSDVSTTPLTSAEDFKEITIKKRPHIHQTNATDVKGDTHFTFVLNITMITGQVLLNNNPTSPQEEHPDILVTTQIPNTDPFTQNNEPRAKAIRSKAREYYNEQNGVEITKFFNNAVDPMTDEAFKDKLVEFASGTTPALDKSQFKSIKVVNDTKHNFEVDGPQSVLIITITIELNDGSIIYVPEIWTKIPNTDPETAPKPAN